MKDNDRTLELWRNEFVVDIETARLARHARGQAQDREMSEASTETLRSIPPSRESTVTIRAISETPHLPADLADTMDLDEPENGQSTNTRPEAALVVATDFGTTFSAVAFAFRDGAQLPTIRMITGYPADPRAGGRAGLEVPTESWYSDASQLAELPFEVHPTPSDDDSTADTDEENIDGVSDTEDDLHLDDGAAEVFADEHVPNMPAERATREFIWGYEIQNYIAANMDPRQFDRISRSKLLLDDSEHTKQVRDDLAPLIKRLKRKRIISNDLDIIIDYLTQLFEHAKQQLVNSFGESSLPSIEHVLSVPVAWKPRALRKMQIAMEAAVRKSQFGTVDNFFLVSEPEAAAAYVLENVKNIDNTRIVDVEEAFLILDAGGGTVDATTYKIDKGMPLRLSKELVKPDGCLHGSSYLNEDFRKYLLKKLETETYLNQNQTTREGIVETILLDFETRLKRSIDVTDPKMRTERITVWGLRDDPEKHFQQNYMFITKNDFRNIFMPHLEAIAELMTKQLNEAKKTEHAVKKVVLVGGFSSSQSLRNYLRQRLLKLSKLWGYKIRLYDTVYAGVPETAIAHGAVLRAMNKEKGPKRIAQCSYGFLRTEPYREWDEHKGVKPFIDELDGEKYVRDTIDWLVKKDAEVEYHEEHIIDAYHLFPAYRRVFKFEEVLYVSDTSFESHYKKSHKKNKGSEVAGRIIADMSFLVKENIIQPIMPDPMSGGKPHYKIEFQLVMIIDGRNLRYEARWPKGNDARVHGSGQICIAAAFQPGTD